MISLARKTLIHEWRRFLPVVLAVCFVGVMLAAQTALILGIFESSAVYVNASSANIWVGSPGTQSVSLGNNILPDAKIRLLMSPDVEQAEPFLWVDGDWRNTIPNSGSTTIYLSGISVSPNAMMFSKILPSEERARLSELGSVIVDRNDLDSLGIKGVGDHAWINGHRVLVVGTVSGMRGLGGVNIISSLETAEIVGDVSGSSDATFYLAKTKPDVDVDALQQRLQKSNVGGPLQVWTADQLSSNSQNYWFFNTGAGMAVMFMAIIVCLVGAIISNQSFASVVSSSMREYATLNALGASRGALAKVIIEEACLVGLVGLILAAVVSTILLLIASHENVPVNMTPLAALGCVVLVVLMALMSSGLALRSVRRTDPAILLR